MDMYTTIYVIFACMGVFVFYLMVRNEYVYRYRSTLIERISKAVIEDSVNKRSWMWRYIEFENVSYERILWTFWKPIGSFYTDMSFIYPEAKEKK